MDNVTYLGPILAELTCTYSVLIRIVCYLQMIMHDVCTSCFDKCGLM